MQRFCELEMRLRINSETDFMIGSDDMIDDGSDRGIEYLFAHRKWHIYKSHFITESAFGSTTIQGFCTLQLAITIF